MARRRGWTYTEERLLIENYKTMTIKELENILPNRNTESINCKIKRLKLEGKIVESKDEDAVKRAYLQR